MLQVACNTFNLQHTTYNNMQILGIIPARYASSRFPGKYLLVVIFAILFGFGCQSMPSSLTILDFGAFSIKVPKDWEKSVPNDQEDSFIGEIVGPQVKLYFDCSSYGYANHLTFTKEEYLTQREWLHDIYFYQTGISFNNGLPAQGVKENIHIPTTDQKIKFPKADYVAEVTYKDSTIYIPIDIPTEIKQSNFQSDSDSNYIYKTIWPKTPGKGLTGLYIHSRSTPFNFQMNGKNLSLRDQNLALQSFKTIKCNIP